MTVSSQVIQYKVLGTEGVQCPVNGKPVALSLHQELGSEPGYPPHPENVRLILDTLGLSGWDLVTLDFPYVFRRSA